MATIVLSAVGASFGGALGGSVLGLSAAVIGRAAGATLGQLIDQRLMGVGSDVVSRGQVDRFRLTGAGEGMAVAQVHGRTRVSGQAIWASNFLERSHKTSGGGKGAPSGPSIRTYSYSVSVAVALCEGPIGWVGRIWADGAEIARDSVTLRVYPGDANQQPDPKIAAIEGLDGAPAYRGTAYVVFEDLDLAPFGNRVPQFSFEVARPDTGVLPDGAPGMAESVRAVCMIPGTGEYALATSQVHYADGPGRNSTANVHTGTGQSDLMESLDALEREVPNCGSVVLVVSWFGDDLRCGDCRLKPKLEHRDAEGQPMAWRVAGEDRLSADLVPQDGGRAVYGATPADASVVEAIPELTERGQKVVFYPFILMEQLAGNGLVNPWTGVPEQPALPWRGRITTSLAPGVAGSPDGTAQAEAEVAAFFGTATAADFIVGDGSVGYVGPPEWTMRRFILHYAALCAAAGGVDAFCIGTEMRGLTQIRGAGHSFPAVAALRDLAAEVRALLGPDTKLSYAADWSEYFGYVPEDGEGHRYFHLDPLWADPQIDFIGIDNYMPLSDWRDGAGHADEAWGTIYDLEYLKANVAGGEGYDWYYPDEAAAEVQDRVPIEDVAHGEPWVFRYKDLVSWWSLPHHERIGGDRQAAPTAWVPQSKPIWFTEFGCAAIDKGTNQPNKFLDPKSSESFLPRASDGSRDDLIQMQYLRAMADHWGRAENNPVSPIYGGAMVDMDRAHVWAWDARPYPWFPALGEVWADRDNYMRGHWLNGRTASRHLAAVVADICTAAGLPGADLADLQGLVRGYGVTQPGSGRETLEPLLTAFGFHAGEAGGVLRFASRASGATLTLGRGDVALHPDQDADISHVRAADGEMAGRIRIEHQKADADFTVATAEAIHPGAEDQAVSQSATNLVLTEGEARRIAERWLSEARVARDSVRLALPPSRQALRPGDFVALERGGVVDSYRVDRVEQFGLALIEAVRVERSVYAAPLVEETLPVMQAPPAALPPWPVFLDLPLLTGAEVEHAPHLAVAAEPWPGEVAVYASPTDSGYAPNIAVGTAASVGVTAKALARAIPGLTDRGPALRVRMATGALASATPEALLAGANVMAIGHGGPGGWEVFQFAEAVLVGPDTYDLTGRLRGQLGTDAEMRDVWPEGSVVVLLDDALRQIDLPPSARGLERHFRIGPADRPLGDPSYVYRAEAFGGIGLRPLSPVHLRRDVAAGDHAFRWIRRTRIDGDLWDAADVPLGEAAEAYLVRVLAPGGAILRQAEVAVPAWTYAGAARAADGVAGAYSIEVAQVSDRFGPGAFRRMDIDDLDG